jgi:protein SCO1/2
MNPERSMQRRSALLDMLLPAAGLLLPAAGLLAGCAGTRAANGARGTAAGDGGIPGGLGACRMEPDGTRSFRNHELVDQDGRTVRFQDDLIRGQVFAATFMYVHCTGICQDMTRRMGEAHELLAPVMGKPVRFYSFSLAEDTPADMKAYMKARGIDGRAGWSFLSAPKAVIRDIRWAFGFFDPNEEIDTRLDGHTGMARFGNHATDKWSACPALGNPSLIARGVVGVLPYEQRALVSALEREERHPARRDPNWRPVAPLPPA